MEKERTFKALINPSCIPKEKECKVSPKDWNPDILGFWEKWQGNKSSDIMVLGQDWGDVNHYRENGANESEIKNPTNERLMKLFAYVGRPIDPPNIKRVQYKKEEFFFTNVILYLKSGGLQGGVKDIWFKNCARFLTDSIEFIKPTVVISLGKRSTNSILHSFYFQSYTKRAMYELSHLRFQLNNKSVLYPVYHCGNRGLQERVKAEKKWNNREETGEKLQKRDWETIFLANKERELIKR